MKHWKPDFSGEYPTPENGCAFVLGGSLHGEIMQQQPLPNCFKHAAPRARALGVPIQPGEIMADEETYYLEELLAGEPRRRICLYIHEGESVAVLLIRAFTELALFARSGRTIYEHKQ
jgi:hypothetical protein